MDLYSLFGLSSSATPAEIERAYRRLARRYHPGINPGDRVAAEMYGAIQDAYQVLGDAERRRRYDQGGGRPSRDEAAERDPVVAFEGFDFSVAAEGPGAATFGELFADVFQSAARAATAPTRGADIALTIDIPFLAAARGATVPVSLTRQERCPSCGGWGRVARHATSCRACDGAGTRRWTRGHMVFTKRCDVCEGRGRATAETCRPCHGFGVTPRTEVVTLSIPAGIEDGARLAVPGRGHAGAQGGAAGDLYVTVHVGVHPYFARDGADLVMTLPVALHEAALGADIAVPTLGGTARLAVPSGTVSGDRLRLPGQGIGGPSGPAGDLVFEIQIVLPRRLDERSKDLLREFGRRNDSDVRRHLFSAG